jgi:hypothetical protein
MDTKSMFFLHSGLLQSASYLYPVHSTCIACSDNAEITSHPWHSQQCETIRTLSDHNGKQIIRNTIQKWFSNDVDWAACVRWYEDEALALDKQMDLLAAAEMICQEVQVVNLDLSLSFYICVQWRFYTRKALFGWSITIVVVAVWISSSSS